ncbi:hypothetical protein D0T11_17365 [Hymenobacter rubripertinctus]|uniref:Uncharacterized protein n=1 Tax=Hymenobacter rubripertinctus TaxID=2029981 RepID=A0A418QPQ0_9BACT|nr:hypothetical protein D0T11_17365 [Hymenobacter rubripertinctus]
MLLGLLFRLQHWAGASALLLGGGGTLVVLYGWWFARKVTKSRLDVLKLSYALSLGLWSLALGLGWRPLLPWLSGLMMLGFWAVLLNFVYVTYGRRGARR